ncbi:unnamed protein product [Nezara viridula]|uniref:Uncharacterized protein n=1 Tax=Nezara viridula TaxID=85310 RepID=A0A9P0EBG0_NEZVI|nr:unnamed protein product [Nezara viridula]
MKRVDWARLLERRMSQKDDRRIPAQGQRRKIKDYLTNRSRTKFIWQLIIKKSLAFNVPSVHERIELKIVREQSQVIVCR